MALSDFFLIIENSTVGTLIREGGPYFPFLESVHVIALTLVVGTIVFIDLRLLGMAFRDLRITTLHKDLLPWTWGAFGLALVTGLLMFSATPQRYFDNTYIRIKFFFMLLAGINMLVFQFITYKNVDKWDQGQDGIPTSARAAGAFSILLWGIVIFFGRWVGFTL